MFKFKDARFRVVLECDQEVMSYSAVCPELPGCASAGDTEEDARRNIEEVINQYDSMSTSSSHVPSYTISQNRKSGFGSLLRKISKSNFADAGLW